MPRSWFLNILTGACAVAIVGAAIAFSPATKVDAPSETTLPQASPPPDWTDPAAVALGRIALQGPAAGTFRFTTNTWVYGAGEYSIDPAVGTVSFPERAGLPAQYLAAVELVRAGGRELHVFSGLDGLWAWVGDDAAIDTSARPAPFRLHLTPEVIRYHVWAKDCVSHVTTDPPEVVNEGFVTYGAARGMTQSIEFLGDNAACEGYEISITSIGGLARG